MRPWWLTRPGCAATCSPCVRGRNQHRPADPYLPQGRQVRGPRPGDQPSPGLAARILPRAGTGLRLQPIQAALFLLTKHRTPDGTRRAGQARIHTRLRKQGARSSAAVAEAAAEAAKSQHTIVPAPHMGEGIVAALAREILTLNQELAKLDALLSEKVTEHRYTEVLLSMPGFGPVLAVEFLGATGGELTVFQTADRFAGVAGLAPAPKDSGRISGNHHRPRRYDRRLLRVFYLSGLSALKSCPASRGYYDRKRGEGKAHVQAMLSLARRRLNVLWAMLRDGTTYNPVAGR